MNARTAILEAIRRNRPQAAVALPEIPAFSDRQETDRVGLFERKLGQMGGTLLRAADGEDPLAPARTMIAAAGGVVCSMVGELPGTRRLTDAAPASLQDVELAVLRARFAVAETGSVALRAEDLGVNAIGYLAQRLLILVDPADILENLHAAYARPEFGEGAYLVLQTGPSATADIEGVLIHGAQGVRALSVLLVGRHGAMPQGRCPKVDAPG